MTRVLILGASGMLGYAVLRVFSMNSDCMVIGTTRSAHMKCLLPSEYHSRIVTGVDVENADSLLACVHETNPDVVINCIGVVKQLKEAEDPIRVLPVNSLLPHRLARLCEVAGARLVHISTDCVFSGGRGMYLESDESDAKDLYGRSKYLGEVDYPNAITLRTSIIGHELAGERSLVSWFLAQEGNIRGYRRAIFSGLPTVELAKIIRDVVIPRPHLHGLYHVSAEPISKFDLLTLVAQVYGKQIEIEPDERLVIDRSLDSSRFRIATGFKPKCWPELVRAMHEFR